MAAPRSRRPPPARYIDLQGGDDDDDPDTRGGTVAADRRPVSVVSVTKPERGCVGGCHRLGSALVPWAGALLLITATVLLLWSIPMILMPAHDTLRDARSTAASVSGRIPAYLNTTDALMEHLTPSNVATLAALVVSKSIDFIAQHTTVGGETTANFTNALREAVALFAESVSRTRRDGIVITVLRPSATDTGGATPAAVRRARALPPSPPSPPPRV